MNDSYPLLSLCLVWPLLGSAALAFVNHQQWVKRLALIVASIELVFCLLALRAFNPAFGGFQLQEDHLWIPGLNIHYQLGVDGISILFLPLTAWVTMMALLASWNSVQPLCRFHLALLLMLESVTIGVFTALDMALFFLFWELTLPPLFFLIGLWGIGAERRYAAMKYTLYMLFGGVPLLFAIILLASNHAELSGGIFPRDLSFSLPVLLGTPIPTASQGVIFLLLLLGFAVKAPLMPFHTWLPSVAMEAPAHVCALLVGFKLGLYGILRFGVPLVPAAAIQYRWLLAILGVVTLLYAGLLALQQSNLRRLLAYASVSHVGLVLLGIVSFNLQGLQGALMQLVNFTLVASSLMLLAGMIQKRLGTSDVLQLGGLAKPMPRLATLFFVFALAGIGVPLTNGFPAELLILLGVLQSFPGLALAVLFGAVIAAAYTLGFVRRGLFGPVKQPIVDRAQDLRPRDLTVLLIPALAVLVLGVYPQWLLSIQESTLHAWVQHLMLPKWHLAEFVPTEMPDVLPASAEAVDKGKLRTNPAL